MDHPIVISCDRRHREQHMALEEQVIQAGFGPGLASGRGLLAWPSGKASVISYVFFFI